MHIVYRARDIAEAHIFAGYLRSHDIECHVGGHYLQGGIGELGMADFAVVRVADEDVSAALELAKHYDTLSSNNHPDSNTASSNTLLSPLLIVTVFLVSVLVLVSLAS